MWSGLVLVIWQMLAADPLLDEIEIKLLMVSADGALAADVASKENVREAEAIVSQDAWHPIRKRQCAIMDRRYSNAEHIEGAQIFAERCDPILTLR